MRYEAKRGVKFENRINPQIRIYISNGFSNCDKTSPFSKMDGQSLK
jgi:hypothetical protein